MIKVKQVIFGTVTKRAKYSLNHQALTPNMGYGLLSGSRLNCILRVQKVSTGNIPGKNYMDFVCSNEKHILEERYCTTNISPLSLNQAVFTTSSKGYAGNILAQVYTGRCHACGVRAPNCWVDMNSHMVCLECVRADVQAPYPYGDTHTFCCSSHKCGKALLLYSDSNTTLYRKAIAIQERHPSV